MEELLIYAYTNGLQPPSVRIWFESRTIAQRHKKYVVIKLGNFRVIKTGFHDSKFLLNEAAHDILFQIKSSRAN